MTYADSRFLVDGSVAHPGAPSYCRTAAFTRLQASKTREARKSTKYQSLAAKEDSKFVPFVMERHGGYGLHAKQFLDEMIRQSKDHIQPSVIRFRDYATRALSVCLPNGNCFVLQAFEYGKYRRDRVVRRVAGLLLCIIVGACGDPTVPCSRVRILESI